MAPMEGSQGQIKVEANRHPDHLVFECQATHSNRGSVIVQFAECGFLIARVFLGPQTQQRQYRCRRYSFIHFSFIPDISIASLRVHHYSEALPDYSIDTVSELTRRRVTGNCE